MKKKIDLCIIQASITISESLQDTLFVYWRIHWCNLYTLGTTGIQEISCENIRRIIAVLIKIKKNKLFFHNAIANRVHKANGSRKANTDKYRLSKINKTRNVYRCFVAINLFMAVMK